MILHKFRYRVITTILTWTICFLLLTTYNENKNLDLIHLVINQFLNPLSFSPGQKLHYLTIVMLLGLYFLSFFRTYRVIMETASTIKGMLKYHSNTLFCYQLSLYNILMGFYIRDFIYLIGCIITSLFVIKPTTVTIMGLAYLVCIWFLVDTLTYFWIVYFCNDYLAIILFICLEIIFRYMLMKLFLVVVVVTILCLIILSLKEVTGVRNSKWKHNKR